MANEFNLQSEVKDNTLIMSTVGYINNNGGQKILEEFNSNYKNGVKSVILNLSQSKVVNSIGISYLIEVIEKLNNNKGQLIFTNLDSSIEKTFTIMGLFQFAKKADNLDEAMKLL